jgi:hypothetical protein
MNHFGPSYLLPDILIGTAAVVAVALFGLHRVLSRAGLPIRDRQRALWMGSSLLVGWCLSALVLSWCGFYQGTSSRIPTVPFGLLLPIAAGILLYRRSPLLRRIVEAVPQSWIVGIQTYRAEGAIFLTLYAAGLLPGAFALPAGIGDVIVGLLAPVVAVAYGLRSRGSAGMLWVWNLLGITDLVVAMTTGFLTSPSPVQIFAIDKPNELVSAFPLAMIPVFLVPLSFLLHFASLAKLRHAEAGQRDLNPRLAGTAA